MKPMKATKFKKALRKSSAVIDAGRGKGSHSQVRVNGGCFTFPCGKEVPGYIVAQAKALGVVF